MSYNNNPRYNKEQKMTKDEVINKFSEVELSFDYYYKYSFTFVGSKDGFKISASFGGNHEEIYKSEVDANDKATLGDENKWSWMWNHIRITKDNEEVFEWFDHSY